MTFNRNKLRFALLMSWRETRAAAGKFAFLVACDCARHGSTDRRHRIQRVRPLHAVARSTLADGRGHFRASAAPAAPVGSSRRWRTSSPRGSRRRASPKPSAWRPRAATFPFSYPSRAPTLSAIPSTATSSWIRAERNSTTSPSPFPTICCCVLASIWAIRYALAAPSFALRRASSANLTG